MLAFMVNGPRVDLSNFLELYRERLTCHQTFAKSRKRRALSGILVGMRRDWGKLASLIISNARTDVTPPSARAAMPARNAKSR
jgi:hypothetical protein